MDLKVHYVAFFNPQNDNKNTVLDPVHPRLFDAVPSTGSHFTLYHGKEAFTRDRKSFEAPLCQKTRE